jgi:hypothetical protein
MTFDLEIFKSVPGIIEYTAPKSVVTGTRKMLQRVLAILLSDDGDLIKYVGGGANASALTDIILVGESGRVADVMNKTTPRDAPDSEVLAELDIRRLEQKGSKVRIDISVMSENSNTDSIILNL